MAGESVPFTILKAAAECIADVTGGKLRGDVVEEDLRDAQRLRHYAFYLLDMNDDSSRYLFAEHHVHMDFPVSITVWPLNEQRFSLDSAEALTQKLNELLEDETVQAYLGAEGR